MRNSLFLLICTLSLLVTGCAGALFGSAPKEVNELEEIGHRRATPKEEKRLDNCLHYIFKKQQALYLKNRKYSFLLKELEPGDRCKDMRVTIEPFNDTYVVSAKIRDGQESVKWSMNGRGEVIEHDDLGVDFAL